MSAFWGNAIGVGIVLLMLVFVALWLWAWSPWHKRTFDALARLPMDDIEPARRGAAAEDAR
jgi:cytochrome c oxidase cbb3-type subunit 4